MSSVDHTAEAFPADKIGAVDLSFKKILVATDGSAPAVRATQFAVAMAKTTGASVTAVFVLTADDALLLPEEKLEEDVSAGVHHSDAGLGLAQKFGAANSVPVDVQVLRGGVAPQIIKFAEQGGFDLIVVGDMGRTGLARLAMGSVAEAVVKASPVPVLVIKR